MTHWRARDHSFHLTYCLNIHPSYNLEEIKHSLEEYTVPLKERLFPDSRMGLGLRLSYQTVEEFHKDHEKLASFKELLNEYGFYVFTLNAFPAGVFQETPVKENVYKPSWLSEDRVRYTRWAIESLLTLLDDGMKGTISTLPGTFREWGHSERQKERIMKNLLRIAYHLYRKRQEHDKQIVLCLEPEPLCTFEKTDEFISFFNNYLLEDGIRQYLDALSLSEDACEEILRNHIGICLDTSHMAVLFEDAGTSVEKLQENNIQIGKMQISSSPALFAPGDQPDAVDQFLNMDEPRFLHQTTGRGRNGDVTMLNDLSKMNGELVDEWNQFDEWRTHFHVPVFLEKFGDLYTTQEITQECLASVLSSQSCSHFEIETYSWDCIPPGMKQAEGIQNVVDVLEEEFRWVQDVISKREYQLDST